MEDEISTHPCSFQLQGSPMYRKLSDLYDLRLMRFGTLDIDLTMVIHSDKQEKKDLDWVRLAPIRPQASTSYIRLFIENVNQSPENRVDG
jgi:hypothetical protein